jgi:penicillin-binding protein 1B
MAIGSYDATPLEMAGAYTVFANNGVRVQPSFVSLVKEPNGKVLLDQKPQTKLVLDPRVTYLMVSMLQEVLQSGTAASVRSRGFTSPAAGKTGTSHDGWFAGFTSNLLCIVWVGFDDNRELDIEGAHSALPIWTEFMKRAVALRRYSDVKPFAAPDGVVTVTIDPESGMPSTPACPQQKPEVFISGTEPVGACPLHGGKGDRTTVSGWDQPAENPPARRETPSAVSSVQTPVPDQPDKQDKPKKKGLFGRLKDVFK